MAADKRSERMLEDILKIPGNERCADCKATAPRWASVNLGIFICVNCATVHRKLGTHKSRVKSVTLDTWSREYLAGMRAIGNTASNAVWNPDERAHPPPTGWAGEDRDSELEKYIRRKYEQGAFKAGAARQAAPTSLKRARATAASAAVVSAGDSGRDRGERVDYGLAGMRGMTRSGSWTTAINPRNPELNDILKPSTSASAVAGTGTGTGTSREKDLPRLPALKTSAGSFLAAQHSSASVPRQRPTPSRSATPQSTAGDAGASLIDMGEGQNATLPLQVQVHASAGVNGMAMGGYGGLSSGMITGAQGGTHAYSTSPNGSAAGSSASPWTINGASSHLQLPYNQQQQQQFAQSSSSMNSYSTSPNPFHSLMPGQVPTQTQLSPMYTPGGSYGTSPMQLQSQNPFFAQQQQQQQQPFLSPNGHQYQVLPNGMQTFGTSPNGSQAFGASPNGYMMGSSPQYGGGGGAGGMMQAQQAGGSWPTGMGWGRA